MNTTLAAAVTSALIVIGAGATFSTTAQGGDISVEQQTLTPAECEKQAWPNIDAGCLVTMSGEHSSINVRIAAQY